MHIITIAQHKGGTGKTTVVAHLAIALWLMNKKIALIDTDPQSSLGTWWFIRQQNNIYTPNIEFFKYSLDNDLLNFIDKFKNSFDIVIIDSPPYNSEQSFNAIKISDFIIIPSQMSPVDLWAMNSTIEFIDKCNKNYKILLNRYNPNLKLSKGLINYLPKKVFQSYLTNKTAYSISMLSGLTVIEINKNNSAINEISNLTNELKESIKI